MSWLAPSSDGGSAVTGYRVYRGSSGGGETLLASVGNVTSYSDGSVVPGSTYFYRVSAVNSAGEGPLSNEVSATASSASAVVSDSFQRSVAAGFGSADVGGAWSVSSTSRTKVSGGEGVVYGWSGGNQDTQASVGPAVANVDAVALVRLSATNPIGAAYSPRLVVRAQSDLRNGYWARLTHLPSGGLGWALARVDNAGGTGTVVLASGSLLSSGAAGSRWWVRLRASGSTIQARFWPDGKSEPTTWQATATDGYWVTGRVAVGVYAGSGMTSPFPDTGIDSLIASDLGS